MYIGIPVGVGVCVLLVCLSVVCTKRKRKQKEREAAAALAEEQIQSESDKYHAILGDGTTTATAGLVSRPNNQNISSNLSAPPAVVGVDGMSRFERLGGDWVGFACRDSGGVVQDSLYFQMRGIMAVGAHRDRMGSYTVDGIVNVREKSANFNKTYATSRATVEYDCRLWDEVCLF